MKRNVTILNFGIMATGTEAIGLTSKIHWDLVFQTCHTWSMRKLASNLFNLTQVRVFPEFYATSSLSRILIFFLIIYCCSVLRYICHKHSPEMLGTTLSDQAGVDMLCGVLGDLKGQLSTCSFMCSGISKLMSLYVKHLLQYGQHIMPKTTKRILVTSIFQSHSFPSWWMCRFSLDQHLLSHLGCCLCIVLHSFIRGVESFSQGIHSSAGIFCEKVRGK